MNLLEKPSKDELEERELLECCAHCGSLHITEEVTEEGDSLYCNDCGILNFTEILTEKEYEEKYKNF